MEITATVVIVVVLIAFMAIVILQIRDAFVYTHKGKAGNQVYCSKCGSSLNPTMVFCPKCGNQRVDQNSSAEKVGRALGRMVAAGQRSKIMFGLGLISWAVGIGLFMHGVSTIYYPNDIAMLRDLGGYRDTVEIAFGAGLSVVGFGLTVVGGMGWYKNK